MPVQINELVIRANITENDQHDQDVKPSADHNGLNKDEIIKECTALVLEIINHKNQR